MSRSNNRAFALYEVLIGLAIFVVGILVLGHAVENCMSASGLSTQEERVRQILANRMVEVQAAPGKPDTGKETKVETGYGPIKLVQKVVSAGLKQDSTDVDLFGLSKVTLTAEWKRGGVAQSRQLQFYVYRNG